MPVSRRPLAICLLLTLIFLIYPTPAPAKPLPKAWLLFHGDNPIRAEIARDDRSRARGLMYRIWLFPNSGMLFEFDPPQPISFWMKNTLIPLEMRFYDRFGRVIAYYPHAMPCTQEPCPLYSSFGNAAYVLETRAQFRATPTNLAPLGLVLED